MGSQVVECSFDTRIKVRRIFMAIFEYSLNGMLAENHWQHIQYQH